METSTGKTPRIEVVDALRGFAILAILLIHCISHFFYPVYPPPADSWLNFLDQITAKVITTLFSGKAYAIFALLFGFTFYIQHSNQRKKGRDFGYRFLWRMVLLAVFALFNAAFFPAGDVLMMFVYSSIILFICRNLPDKVVLIIIIILLSQPIEWVHLILSRINPSYQLPDFGIAPLHEKIIENTKNGNLIDFFRMNITLGLKVSLLWAIESGRTLQVAGLFLLGFYIGRKQFFVDSVRNLKFWQRVSIICFVLAVLLQFAHRLTRGDEMLQSTAGLAISLWQNIALTFVLVAVFVLLYRKIFFRKILSPLRYYGKMSLTNYVSQSVFGAFVFFPIGLHLAPHSGYTVSFLIGMVIFTVQMIFSKWWLSKHKQGPLEGIWHKWTWINFSKKTEEKDSASLSKP